MSAGDRNPDVSASCGAGPIDPEMLRRAAEACRNASAADWFQWVPKHLDDLADRLSTPAPEPVRAPAVSADLRADLVEMAERWKSDAERRPYLAMVLRDCAAEVLAALDGAS